VEEIKGEYQMEALIEELDNIIHDNFAVSYPPWDKLGHEDLARSMIIWTKIIARTLKAVVDGMPLHPWEVGRIEGALAEEISQHFFLGTEFSGKSGSILIALSPTEEEK